MRVAPAALIALGVLISGCTPSKETPVTSVKFSGNALVSAESITLTPNELRAVSDTSVNSAYRLGPDDVISITVYLHPELSVPQANSTTGGALITSDGTVELPLIGNIDLGGLTLSGASAILTDAYSKYVTDPKVAVQLQAAQSLRYYLLGAFQSPGIKFPVHQLTLLEALALGGTVDIAGADLYQAYVAQGSIKLPVDLYALLINGDLSQNIMLQPGDAIVVPPSTNENAFIFGSVGKPGPVQFQSGALSLLQALSSAGMDLTSYTNARLSRVHIIRAQGKSAQFLIVDAMMILKGEAPSFSLQPGDVVFVPPTEVATWNQIITQFLPSLTTVSDVLNPFVQIKFLRERNE